MFGYNGSCTTFHDSLSSALMSLTEDKVNFVCVLVIYAAILFLLPRMIAKLQKYNELTK